MSDEITALDAITDRVLDRGLGALWDRLSPLSAGAVASSAAIVAGCSLLRRVLNPDRDRSNRSISWVGLVILAPVALWLLTRARDADTSEPMAAEEPGQPAGSVDLGDSV